MGGFTGFVGETKRSASILDNMLNQIIHRGPEFTDFFIEDEMAFGLRQLWVEHERKQETLRLSEQDDDLVLLLDGNIFNLEELQLDLLARGCDIKRNTESEILLHGYKEYGEGLPGKLRGVFSFVILDRREKRVFGARDRLGVKPYYYAHMNGTFFSGSEVKSFLPHPNFIQEFNEQALKPFLTFQFSALNETFFKGVHKLPPAHYLIFEDGQIKTKRYWMPEFRTLELNLDEVVKEIDHAVRNSIHTHSVSGARVGSFLSSGVDSSYIASVAKPDQTFTVGFSKQSFSEIDNAKALSDYWGIENYNEVLDPELCFEKLDEIQYMMDEPHADPSIVPLYFLAQLASQHVDVAFSGEGADELFAGYAEYDGSPMQKKLKALPGPVRRGLGLLSKRLPKMRGKQLLAKVGLPPEEWFIGQAKIFEESELTFLKEPYNGGVSVKEITQPYYDLVKNEDDLTKMQFLDLHLWMPHDILLKADKMSNAHSLEVRMPLLDREVIRVASSLPERYRINEQNTKYAFRLAAKRSLPEDYAKRKKIGFPVPIRHWMKEETYYRKIKFSFESHNAGKFFNQNEILQILDDHYQGKAQNGRKVWTIYTFLVWYKKYFDESPAQHSLGNYYEHQKKA